MDNKNNRAFYWEVKDFLNKKSETFEPKKNSLKDSINGILNEKNTIRQNSFNPNTNTTKDVSKYLHTLMGEENKALPSSIAHAKNSLVNPFALNEVNQPSVGSNTSTRPSWKDQNPEKYAENVQKRQDQETARKTQRETNVRRTKEDEASAFNKSRPEDSMLQGPTESGGNVGDQAKAAQGLQMGLNGNPNLPSDTPENREKLKTFRADKDRETRSSAIAATVERLSGKDPASLTAKENAELQMANVYMKGGSLSKGDSGLESKVREKLSTSMAPKVGSASAARDQAYQGPTQTGGNVADDPLKYSVDSAMQRTLGRSTENLAQSTQNAVGREAEIKKQEDAAVSDKIKQDRYDKMQGQRIQGTNMTYADYKSKFGKDYNAFDKGESSMLNKVAGAGRYGSEEARQGAISSYQFNQTYDKQNTAMAQKGGELTRQVDKSQVELDRFKNMTPAERQAAARQEVSNIQAQPGFVAGVAKNMASGINQAQQTANKAKENAKFAQRAAQPGKVGVPNLISKPANVNAPNLLARDNRMPLTPDLLSRVAQPQKTPPYGGVGSVNYNKAPSLISRPGQTPPDSLRRR